MNICFHTFGCRLNRAEALDEEAAYIERGWRVTPNHSDADMIVVRCCAVTRRAQRECEKLIDHIKRKYPNKRLKICGCTTLKEKNPLPEPQSKAVSVRTSRAYLKVQDGCAGKCTFCIVPKFRGTSQSLDFTELLDKAKRFIDAGYHEIVVTGCNLSLFASHSKRLPELLSSLASLDENCRIRLGSLEPSNVSLETLNAISENKNICRYLHIPIQSGSNKILIAMRRPYLLKDVENIILHAKKLMPGIALGCDLMTGFPGESDLDFQLTKLLLKKSGIPHAHIFPYSEREGTIAATYPDSVPKEIRHFRAKQLSLIGKSNLEHYAKSFISKTVDVLIEDEKAKAGWTQEYLWCSPIDKHHPMKVERKKITKFKILESSNGELKGIIV